MLKRLQIANYALIEHLDIKFSKQLNIITGETGAGKSILFSALGLILGNRADKKVVSTNNSKCMVEGEFIIDEYRLKDTFEALHLDYFDECIIRREINSQGRSRSFVNDSPVTLDVLKQITSKLVDLHRQHESLVLNSPAVQMQFLDDFSGAKARKKTYTNAFEKLQSAKHRLNELLYHEQKARQDEDYWKFQFNELDSAALKPGEAEEIENRLKQLTRSEGYKIALRQAFDAIEGNSGSVEVLNTAYQALKKFESVDDELVAVLQRLNSTIIELSDISASLQQKEQALEFSPDQLAELEERSDELNRLLKKYHATDENILLEIQMDLEAKLEQISTFSVEIEKLKRDVVSLENEAKKAAIELSDNRRSCIPDLEGRITQLLQKAGMPNAVFTVDMQMQEQLNQNGFDEIDFRFSANKGQPARPIQEIASGGELSRLMLSFKSAIAGSTTMPTLIFDEIDAGISGEVAMRVGGILNNLSAKHQLIVITHLPQIASRGHHHIKIFKNDTADKTISGARLLSADERIIEVAELLSGAKPGQSSVQAARELLSN